MLSRASGLSLVSVEFFFQFIGFQFSSGKCSDIFVAQSRKSPQTVTGTQSTRRQFSIRIHAQKKRH